jgi:hypothetical protein
MNLEQLQARSNELQNALVNTTQQMYVIQGHKQEVDYQIHLLNEIESEKVRAAAAEALASQTESPVQ